MNQRLKPHQVASMWQCSTRQVISLINSGKLRAINISTATKPRYVVDPEEVKRFEQSGPVEKPKLVRRKEPKVKNHLRV